MRSTFLYLIILILLSTAVAKSQVSEKDLPQSLEILFDRLVENSDDKDRIRINDSIKMALDNYIKSDSLFSQKLSNLRYLGQIISPDSLLKIITWNLILKNEPSLYFCYFIRKKESGKEKRIYKLSVGYNTDPIKTDTTFTKSDWYGALYYDLRPYIIDNRRCWVLLGINFGNSSITRKIIDVLSFTPEDSILFGRKLFISEKEARYRAVFEYASDAIMSLRFRSDSSIVFDHLVPFQPSMKDDHRYYGPDYSFDAYNLKNGFWKLTINVDARNQ